VSGEERVALSWDEAIGLDRQRILNSSHRLDGAEKFMNRCSSNRSKVQGEVLQGPLEEKYCIIRKK